MTQPAYGGDKATAEALFREGKQLMKDGALDEACAKFQASWEADPAIGALLNLALCHQKQGKTASAWAEFTQAAALARRAGDDERTRGAKEHADALEPRLSRVTIVVDEAPPELTVKRNGVDVAGSSLGEALPVDPGEHEIVAMAPGYETWSTTVTVRADGDHQSVSIPALKERPDEVPVDRGEDRGSAAQSIAGWTFVGVGGAGLAVGAVLGIVATVKVSELEDGNCPDHACNEEGQQERDQAEAIAHGCTAMFIIGGALAVTGLVLLLTDDTGDDAEEADELSVSLLPSFGPTDAGLTLTGRF